MDDFVIHTDFQIDLHLFGMFSWLMRPLQGQEADIAGIGGHWSDIVAGPHSPLCCAAALTPCELKSRQYVFGSQAK